MAGGHGGKFNPVDVTAPHVAYTVLGGFTVIFGMLSLFIRERMYIGEALIAFLFGVVVGPQGANIFNPRDWTHGNEHHVNEITLELTRIVLAIGVFAIGVELPKAYMARHWKSLFYLLGPVMTYGWFVSAGIIYALIPALTFKSSLAIAAALTPTDPILAAAVVGGGWADKHVPAHLRHLLAAESGCNDGAAFPFLFIAIYLTTYDNVGHAIRDWFLITWLYEIVLSCILGAIIGFLFRHLMKFCERKELIDRQSYVAQYVSLAMFANGVTTLIGSDDLLAAFAAGAAFAWDGFFNRQTEAAVFSSVIDLLFNVATFIYLGAWMPFESFTNVQLTLAPWRLLVIGLLVLLLRRLPIILALYRWIPDIKTFREAVFAGHFGPMGVGAIFIATLAAKKLPDVPETGPENQAQILAATIQPVVAFMVICSIAVHGLSIPFFSLGRRVHSVRRTWSRQRSKEATPEWAHGMRHADAPEDVVVNRDGTKEVATTSASGSENEKTEAPVAPAVDDAERERLARAIPDMLDDDGGSDDEVDSANPTRSPSRLVHPASADAARFIDSHAGTPTSPQGEHRPYEIPKDRVLVAEWREGPHLVVEHKAQDDDTGEVEVEVVHDAFASNEHLRLQSEIRKFAGTPDRVKNEVQEHIEKLGQRAGEKFEELMRSGSLRSSVGGSSDQGHAKAKDTDKEKKEAEAEDGNAPTPPKARGVATPGDGDESSGPESSGSADIAVPPTARRRGSGSGHRPHVSLTIQAPSQLASPTLATSPNTDTEALSPDDTPSRGRATAVPARLRPREVSPGRSIRFAVGDDTAHDRDAPTPGSPRTANHSRGDSVTRAGRSGSGLGMPRTSSYNGGSGMGLPRTSSVTNGSGLGMSRTSSIQGGSGVGLPSRTQTQSINGGAGGGSGLGMPRTDSKR